MTQKLKGIMGIGFYVIPVAAACRSFSTRSGGTATKFGRSSYSNRTNKSRKSEPRIKLTNEQKNVLAYVERGFSVFITGSAGTGKTVLLNHIISFLKNFHGESKVFVTASTGVAACALHGQTLHSFAGFGIQNVDPKTLLHMVLKDMEAIRRWLKAKALIIDEISMVDAHMFESLEFVARTIRNSGEVWGGIQLIVSGDFLQLPPVLDGRIESSKVFAFEADCWDQSFGTHQFEITKVFRQSDARLINLLQGVRRGNIVAKDLELLEQTYSVNEPDPSAVRLYPLKREVRKVNEARLKSLNEKTVTYKASDGGRYTWELNKGIAPKKLVLCKGARVMLIKNLNVPKKLCNGATGTITGFVPAMNKEITFMCPDNLFPVVKFDSGSEIVIKPAQWQIFHGERKVAWRLQIPLILGWALSIHKCQGMTLDCLHTDLSSAFGCGMVFVALSRVRKLEGLHLSGFCPSKIMADPEVLQFYQRFSSDQHREDEEVDDHATGSKKKQQ